MRELGRGGALVAAAVAHLENKANHRPAAHQSTERSAQMPLEVKKPAGGASAPRAPDGSSSEGEEAEAERRDKASTASESARSSERDSESDSSAASGSEDRPPQDKPRQGSQADIHHLLLQHILILAIVSYFTFFFVFH